MQPCQRGAMHRQPGHHAILLRRWSDSHKSRALSAEGCVYLQVEESRECMNEYLQVGGAERHYHVIIAGLILTY